MAQEFNRQEPRPHEGSGGGEAPHPRATGGSAWTPRNLREVPKPTNLVRSFALLSLISIAVICSVAALLLSRFMERALVQRDAIVTAELIQSIAEHEEPELAFDRPELLTDEEGLGELFIHITKIPDVLRANVFAPDRSIVWSNDLALVGQRFVDNDELEEALRGEMVVELGRVAKSTKNEHAFFPDGVTDFVENYVPIWAHDHSMVVGVVEIYRTPVALFETIRDGTWLVWSIALASGVFLYTTLFWVVHRAANVMRRQHALLVESETMVAVGEMATAVAHGIRNPLASIRSSAELALEEETTEIGREATRDVILEVDRIGQWLREMLLFARPERGELFEVDLGETVRRSLDNFQRTMARQHIRSQVHIADALPPVKGDAQLLTQMFNSIIANAVEAMPNGGSLDVRAALCREGKELEMTLSDTGTGIPRAHLDQVLKPFFTSKRSGLGIGLQLVKRIVERHGGRIMLSSVEGQGTTVTLTYPVPGA